MWKATRIAGGVLVACVVTAACSGDDDASSTTTSITTSAPSSTESSTTTPATTPPTSSTSTSPTTSSAPPTSSSTQPLTDEQAVLAAYEAAYNAFWAASQDPNDPALRRVLELTHSGDGLEAAIDLLDRYVANDRRVEPNRDVEHGFVIVSSSLDDNAAVLLVCSINPWILVEGTGPDSSVLDDQVIVSELEEHLQLIEGTWRLSESFVVGDLSDNGGCHS